MKEQYKRIWESILGRTKQGSDSLKRFKLRYEDVPSKIRNRKKG